MTSRDIPRLPSFWDREIPTFSADTWSESLGLPVPPGTEVFGWFSDGMTRPGKAGWKMWLSWDL